MRTSRNEIHALCQKLATAGYTDIEVAQRWDDGIFAIVAVPADGTSAVRFEDRDDVIRAALGDSPCEIEWGSCEEDFAHECGRPVAAPHVHTCRHCGTTGTAAA